MPNIDNYKSQTGEQSKMDDFSNLNEASISVVIVNYNSGGYLVRAVESLLAQPQVAEIIVVDNNSHDDSIFLLTTEFSPETNPIILLLQKVNEGFSKGCNRGFAASKSQLVLFFNPDCTITKGALGIMQKTLIKYPDCATVGPLIVYPNGIEQGGARRDLPTPLQFISMGSGLVFLLSKYKSFKSYNLDGTTIPLISLPIQALSGACFLIRREDYQMLNGLDEGYFFNFEDLDLCQRLADKGRKIRFEPRARVVHERGVCRKVSPFLANYHTYISCVRYFRKHFSQPSNYIWLLALVLLLTVHFFLFIPKAFYRFFRYSIFSKSKKMGKKASSEHINHKSSPKHSTAANSTVRVTDL
ncbi:MAG: glycosyltransferase family 2 protein [Magnetococcales bacterium]|nr:glycosyltransferase family 2 protein [Magnetococcales bacterium]